MKTSFMHFNELEQREIWLLWKGQISWKWKSIFHVLTLISFQTCMTYFLTVCGTQINGVWKMSQCFCTSYIWSQWGSVKFGFRYSSKCLILCSSKERKGWVNDDNFLFFGRTIPLKLNKDFIANVAYSLLLGDVIHPWVM